LDSLELVDDEGHEDRTEFQRHAVNLDVPLRDIYEQLLINLIFSRLSDTQNFLGVIVVIRDYLTHHPDARCAVYEMSHGESRERTLNQKGEIPNLFQGAAPVQPVEQRGEIYPGDREIRAPDRVTVQVHTLRLESPGPNSPVYEDVPNVAIWLPPGIGGDVLIQDQGGTNGTGDS
jgi:hypothetical protein